MTNLLSKIRIFDEDGTVSHTSLYLYAGLILLFVSPTNEWTVAIMTLIFAHTNLKRLSRYKAKVQGDSTKATAKVDSDRFEALEKEIQNLKQISSFRGKQL